MSDSIILSALKVAGASGVLYVVWQIVQYMIIEPLRSPLWNLPGIPTPGGILSSNLREVMDPAYSPFSHDKYSKQFGKTFRVQGFGYFDHRVMTLDARALSHVLNSPMIYEKPWQSRRMISNLIGEGLLSSEGLHHKKQRKVMNPAFSNQNMKAYAPLFLSKAHELRRRWLDLITPSTASPVVDMVHWLSRATFDVIGLAGFDYAFNAIQKEDNEVYMAYKDMFDLSIGADSQSFRFFLGIWWPWVDKIWPTAATRVVEKSHKVIYGVGNDLVQAKKKEIMEGRSNEANSKSMLSLLIKSNLSNTNVEQQITDKDIMDQINTFFFAGSDTTSLGIAWTLMLLAKQPLLQSRLREEILASSPPDEDETATFDFSVIDSLPFLDKVAKEALRLIPPVHSSVRVAGQDDVIPTQHPVKMKDGSETHGIPIRKGQFVHVPIEGFNMDKSVWGEDAWRFMPDRWDNLPEAVKSQPGLWSNIMTFSAGPRSCIGMRFSVMEMKSFLYVLVPAFTFELDAPTFKVNLVLTRPYVKGEYAKGSQMPLKLRPYSPTA